MRKQEKYSDVPAADNPHLRAMKTSTEGEKQLANPCRLARIMLHRATGRRPNLSVEVWTSIKGCYCGGRSLCGFLLPTSIID